MDVLQLTKTVRRLLLLFICCLVVSGLTALPIEWELRSIDDMMIRSNIQHVFNRWFHQLYMGVRETNIKYPFIAYGTDWLAFAHLMIAAAFIGPLRNPVRNIWVVEFGMIACVSVIPFAFIAGAMRGIPLYWRLIDCSFGLFGGLLLLNCYKRIKRLERKQNETTY